MFKRLLVTELMQHTTLIGFSIFFLAFIFAVVWVLRMPRNEVQRLENLPLENELPNNEHHA